MKIKNVMMCALSAVLLCSCGNTTDNVSETSETEIAAITEETTAEETTVLESDDTQFTDESSTTESSVPTASSDVLRQFINNFKLPTINITESSAHDEIIQAGKIAAAFYSEAAKKYFGYGVERNWLLDQSDGSYLEMEEMTQYQTVGGYWKSLGLYTDARDAYVPLGGTESKQFLIDCLHLTEKGYDDLCKNSPSTYTIKDGSFYVSSGDGGEAGWSYSRIVDYSIDDKVITFNCERVGDADDWGYDEDLIQPFTFEIAFGNDVPKLNGVSYSEGFFDLSAKEYAPTDEEKQQIQSLLTDTKAFFYDYINCKEICKNTDANKVAATQKTINNGTNEDGGIDERWLEVTDDEVMSLSDLNAKMDKIFTANMIGSLDDTIAASYHEENGKLYLSENAGSDGGLLGTDTVYIKSVGMIDDDTFILYMTAFGAGENWDLDNDLTEDFTVLLKKCDNGFKVEECSVSTRSYIEWCYHSEDDVF